MDKGKYILKRCIIVVLLLTGISCYAQNKNELVAVNSTSDYTTSTVTAPKIFSNSETPDVLFTVETNIDEKKIRVTTNYQESFKIRFIDYYGKSLKLHKDINSGQPIDVSAYIDQLLIMNIMDNKNKLLSSQAINLKRRSYW